MYLFIQYLIIKISHINTIRTFSKDISVLDKLLSLEIDTIACVGPPLRKRNDGNLEFTDPSSMRCKHGIQFRNMSRLLFPATSVAICFGGATDWYRIGPIDQQAIAHGIYGDPVTGMLSC